MEALPVGVLLMNLRAIAEPGCDDRDVVDLLFFPTGGGKTEAYLGLAAFTLVLRRLRNPGITSAGLSVLMRYTLRLSDVRTTQPRRDADLRSRTGAPERRGESWVTGPLRSGCGWAVPPHRTAWGRRATRIQNTLGRGPSAS
jgi:hypothetical protein